MLSHSFLRFSTRPFLLLLCLLAGASRVVVAQGPAAQSTAGAETPAVRLSLDDAVKSALEHNLDLQVERFNPTIVDDAAAQVRNTYVPTLSSRMTGTGQTSPPSSFLVGLEPVRNRQVQSNFGLQQMLPWGGYYSATWDASRSTTNSIFTNFNPSLRSNMNLLFSQPLLRNFSIDPTRQQILVLRKNREISDVQLRQAVVQTMTAAKAAYWDLAYAIASLAVQRDTLALAEELLKSNRLKVEVGTLAPIDVLEAESEVAKSQDAVIVAEGAIKQAEDRLRALVLDSADRRFWDTRIEPTTLPTYEPHALDVAALIRAALDKRTDLSAAKKTVEANDVNIRYFRNQLLPDVRLEATYNTSGIGGTEFLRTDGFPGTIVGTVPHGFGSVLNQVVTRDFPAWTVALNVSYPIGASVEEAGLARARVLQNQAQARVRSLEMHVVAQVREAARQVDIDAKRVEAIRAARVLNERKLDAEQKKFNVGMSTSFFVVQAQRDLAQARNAELNAILAYDKALVTLDGIQEANVAQTAGGLAVSLTGQTGNAFDLTGNSTTFGTSTFGAQTTGGTSSTRTTAQQPF